MANKVYNLNGGLYSGDAFTAFETRVASSNNGSIVASPSDLKVSAGSGMNATVSTGAGIIGNGTLSGVRFAIDSPVTVAVSAASTANPRMDSVVAYIDKSVSASTSVVDNTDLGIVKFKSVAGTPASAPTAPSTATIQSSIGAGNPYMVLANITVPKSSTAASSFTITDTRVTPTSAIITDGSITTPKLANKAVTSDKVDWATFPSSSLVADGSNTTPGVGTVYYKRLLPNIYLLWGNITPTVAGASVALPHPSFSTTHSQVFTLYGSMMNSTKGFISNTDRTHIGFTAQNTGNTYALWGIAFLDESA